VSEACKTDKIFLCPEHVGEAATLEMFQAGLGKEKTKLHMVSFTRIKMVMSVSLRLRASIYLTLKSSQEIQDSLETFDGRGNKTRLLISWRVVHVIG